MKGLRAGGSLPAVTLGQRVETSQALFINGTELSQLF